MYIVSHNLTRLFKWISNTANRKWRDRTNGKNVGKIKMWILCMDVIYGGRRGEGEWKREGGWRLWGSQVNIQRTFSVTYFESWDKRRQKTKSTYFANNQWLWIKFSFDSHKLRIYLAVWECRRSSRLEVFLGKGILKICNKFKGEHPCQSVSLNGCYWYRLVSTLCSCIWKGVNLHVVETKWEDK